MNEEELFIKEVKRIERAKKKEEKRIIEKNKPKPASEPEPEPEPEPPTEGIEKVLEEVLEIKRLLFVSGGGGRENLIKKLLESIRFEISCLSESNERVR